MLMDSGFPAVTVKFLSTRRRDGRDKLGSEKVSVHSPPSVGWDNERSDIPFKVDTPINSVQLWQVELNCLTPQTEVGARSRHPR
jgi:hypothetical protein